jgi:hypothetical protein
MWIVVVAAARAQVVVGGALQTSPWPVVSLSPGLRLGGGIEIHSDIGVFLAVDWGAWYDLNVGTKWFLPIQSVVRPGVGVRAGFGSATGVGVTRRWNWWSHADATVGARIGPVDESWAFEVRGGPMMLARGRSLFEPDPSVIWPHVHFGVTALLPRSVLP